VERAESKLQGALDAYLVSYEKCLPELEREIDVERAEAETRLVEAVAEAQSIVGFLGLNYTRDLRAALFPGPAWDPGNLSRDPTRRQLYDRVGAAIEGKRAQAGKSLRERLSDLRNVKRAFTDPGGPRAFRQRVLNRAREALEGAENGSQT
jgi:hypothetical protein